MSESIQFIERAQGLMSAIGLGQPGTLRHGQENPETDWEIQHHLNQQAHRFTGAHCLIACSINPKADLPFLLELIEGKLDPTSSTTYIELTLCHPSFTDLTKETQKEIDAAATLYRSKDPLKDQFLRNVIFTYVNLIPELQAILRLENGMKIESDLREFCIAHIKSYL